MAAQAAAEAAEAATSGERGSGGEGECPSLTARLGRRAARRPGGGADRRCKLVLYFFGVGKGSLKQTSSAYAKEKKRKVWGRPKKKELGLDDFPQQIAVACNSLPSAPRCSKNRIDLVSPSGEATSLGLEVLT